MIKVFKILTVCLSIAGLLVACGKKDDGNNQGSGNVAYAPNSNCMAGPQPYGQYPPNNWNTNCGTYYQNYGNGYQPYPYNQFGYVGYDSNYQNGFCSCPMGYRPIVGAQGALGCVSTQMVQNNQNYVGYSWNNSGWINNPQVPYNQGSNGCYQQALAQCDTTIPNSCGFYGYCQPNGGGNRVGICIRQPY